MEKTRHKTLKKELEESNAEIQKKIDAMPIYQVRNVARELLKEKSIHGTLAFLQTLIDIQKRMSERNFYRFCNDLNRR